MSRTSLIGLVNNFDDGTPTVNDDEAEVIV